MASTQLTVDIYNYIWNMSSPQITQTHYKKENLLIVNLIVGMSDVSIPEYILKSVNQLFINPYIDSKYRITLEFEYDFEIYSIFKGHINSHKTESDLEIDLDTDDTPKLKLNKKFSTLIDSLNKLFKSFSDDAAIFETCKKNVGDQINIESFKKLNYLYKKYNKILTNILDK